MLLPYYQSQFPTVQQWVFTGDGTVTLPISANVLAGIITDAGNSAYSWGFNIDNKMAYCKDSTTGKAKAYLILICK